jgi:hypothetical protein
VVDLIVVVIVVVIDCGEMTWNRHCLLKRDSTQENYHRSKSRCHFHYFWFVGGTTRTVFV